MTRDEYLLLFDKHINGEATPEEIALLMQYQDDFELSDEKNYVIKKEDRAASKRILASINQSTGHRRARKIYSYTRWYAAALILVVFTVGLLTLKYPYNDSTAQNLQAVNKITDVKPGEEKAILTLANGKRIILNDAASGTLVKQGNIIIKKQKNGMLEYVVSPGSPTKAHAVEYNIITTPRGGEYQIALPDGSKVWLNAASSLKFPTAFTSHERKVELTGEGYFEIAEDKHKPFKVKFNDQVVEVLGTHFDIMAYDDEAEAKTTLLEGSVKISRDNINQILLPGQQAVASLNQQGFKVQQANMQQVLAWKNGYFIFRSVSIDVIMRQAARWYDVDIVYEGDWKDKEYGGRISKYKNISELLYNLELTGTVHFKVEGRRVTVMR